MHTMTVTLRTVTPVILGGAAEVPAGAEKTKGGLVPIFRVPAEIRPPSIRGAMRFWFRALWGEGSDRGLREYEARYFGSTTTGQCPVRMRWHGNASASRPWHMGGSGMGIRYLGFTLDTHVKVDGQRVRRIREYIEPGYEFRLIFRSSDLAALKVHWAAMWLLGHLGGVGLRSRRGFGSLTIREVAGAPFALRVAAEARSAEEAAGVIGEGIQCLARELGLSVDREPSGFAQFHRAQPIRVLGGPKDGWKEWRQALDGIGLALQQFRRGLMPISRRAPFGLPLQRVSEDERHASPLFIHIGEMSSGAKFVVLTAFHSSRLMGDWNALRKPQSDLHRFVEEIPGGIPVAISEA
jgi:CRISPR-associated protein Cmr1